MKSNIDRRVRTDINKSKDQRLITPGARKTIGKSTRQAGPGTQCYYCNKYGHFMKDCRIHLREPSRGRRGRVRSYIRNRGGRGNRGRGGQCREGPPSERYRHLPDTQSPKDQCPSASWHVPPDSSMGHGAALGSSPGYRSQQGNGGWQSRGFITNIDALHTASNGNKSQEFWFVLELAQISTLIRDRVDTVADRWANFRVPKSDQILESLKTDSKSRYPKLDGPPVCTHLLPHRISRMVTDMVADSK